MNAISRPDPQPEPRPEIRPETRPETRTERHMRMCQRLAELALDLAEVAAKKAKEELENPAPAKPKTPDAATLFTRLSTAVRQAIALEVKLAGTASRAAAAPEAGPEDPRRDIIRQVLDISTAKNPDRGQLRRDIMRLVDKAIEADPEGNNEPFDIIQPIFNDHNLAINYNQIYDDLLDKLCRPGVEPVSDPLSYEPGYPPHLHTAAP
jgi:hypothetical protein